VRVAGSLLAFEVKRTRPVIQARVSASANGVPS
jgi:hypothetical protein